MWIVVNANKAFGESAENHGKCHVIFMSKQIGQDQTNMEWEDILEDIRVKFDCLVMVTLKTKVEIQARQFPCWPIFSHFHCLKNRELFTFLKTIYKGTLASIWAGFVQIFVNLWTMFWPVTLQWVSLTV